MLGTLVNVAAVIVAMLCPVGSAVAATDSTANRFPVRVSGKYGYINRAGKLVIRPQYDMARDFHEDRALVNVGGYADGWSNWEARGGLWGVIDTSGNYVCPPSFPVAFDYSEGLAAAFSPPEFDPDSVSVGGWYYPVAHGWGFIGRDGRYAIRPAFDDAGEFKDGLAQVNLGASTSPSLRHFHGGLWGFCDTAGAIVIPCSYEEWPHGFGNGRAAVYIHDSLQEGFGFIDRQGRVAIPPIFTDAGGFREGHAAVRVGLGESARWGFVDTAGSFVVPARYSYARAFSEGLAAVCTGEVWVTSGIPHGGSWGFVAAGGELAVPLQFDEATYFSEGLAAVRIGTRWGYIDRTGAFVVKPGFDGAVEFRGGLARVRVGDKSGYIDKRGRWVWRPTR